MNKFRWQSLDALLSIWLGSPENRFCKEFQRTSLFVYRRKTFVVNKGICLVFFVPKNFCFAEYLHIVHV